MERSRCRYYLPSISLFIYIFVRRCKPPGLKPGDPRWIGAWWMSYLISAAILIVCSIFILGYPKHVPGAREKREKAIASGELPKEDKDIQGEWRKIIPAALKLTKNPTFMLL